MYVGKSSYDEIIKFLFNKRYIINIDYNLRCTLVSENVYHILIPFSNTKRNSNSFFFGGVTS